MTSLAGSEEENELFYFESDHLAVKGNKDYSELVKTLFLLQAQQQRAVKDYETTENIRQQCLRDPLGTMDRLKSGETLGIPDLQVIAEIPEINWSKYNVVVPEEGLKMLDSDTKLKNASETSKVKDGDGITETHNKPWTVEEQKRLEELLLIYPPEPIELRRFKKIAAALGNRTAKQVCSRVQKYFLKLYKAGLPIPGRIPKASAKCKKAMHKHQRLNHFLFKPTTFFPELDVPVKMNENEDAPGPKMATEPPSASHSNYLLPGSYGDNMETQTKSDVDCQVELLKRVRHEKERTKSAADRPAYHFGYKCDFCNEEPITGTRWHCVTCTNTSVDFCTDCLVSQMYSEVSHPLTHKFSIVRNNNNESTFNSDTESNTSSEKNRNSSSSDEGSDSRKPQEYGLSDLEMDENSDTLMADTEAKDSEDVKKDTSSTLTVLESNNQFDEDSEDTPYAYLCSVLSSNNCHDTNTS